MAVAAWLNASAFAEVLTFTPTADTTVSNKYATTNYGTTPTMTANNNNGIRVLLVRFDLSGVSAPISNLKLNLKANTGSAPSRPVKIFGLLNGQDWIETGVTWSTAPGVNHAFTANPWAGTLSQYLNGADLFGGGAALATFTPAGGSAPATAFDVASGPVFDFLAADADKIVTFLIAVDDTAIGGTTGGQVLSTREAAADLPLLTVTTSPPPVVPPPVEPPPVVPPPVEPPPVVPPPVDPPPVVPPPVDPPPVVPPPVEPPPVVPPPVVPPPPVGIPAVVTFNPVADTYVSNKYATVNYGAATTMAANNNNSIRVLLVRFDLSAVTTPITQLKLNLTANSGSAVNRPVKIFGVVTGQDWIETGVAWNTAPGVNRTFTANPWAGTLSQYLNGAELYGGGAALATFTPAGGSALATAFDVTSGPVFDFLAADADKIVTFLIAVDDTPVGGTTGGQVISTREAATGRPLLTVTTLLPPPPPPPPNPTVVTFQPVADTYVSNKSLGTNYGAATTVAINNNSNGHRVALLRFDLSSISGTITNLRLDLTGAGMSVGKTLNVYGVIAGEGWTETGANWTNAPGVNHAWSMLSGGLANYLFPGDLYGGGTILSTFTPTASAGTLSAFNASNGPVLNFVNADADKIVTFLIAETDPADEAGNSFSTREAPARTPLLTVSCVPTSTAPAVIRVVLLGGQSNAVGTPPATTLPPALLAPQTDVLLYSQVDGQQANADGSLGALRTLHAGVSSIVGSFGSELTLGQQLSPLLQAVPGTRLAIIKFGRNGTSLSTDWKAGGTGATTGDGAVYQTFQQVVNTGLAKLSATYPTSVIRLDGMVWVQGEQDTNTLANATAYGSRLASLIADVRATYGATLPFFFSRLSAQQTYYSDPLSARYPAYLQLRQGQQNVAAAVPGAHLLDIDGPAFTVGSDFIHFDAAGQQALGSAFAARVADVVILRITSITVTETGVHLTWNAIPGRSYSIQTSADLVTWSAPIFVGVAAEWTEPSPGSLYYRVLEN